MADSVDFEAMMTGYRVVWFSVVALVGGLCSLVALLGDNVWLTAAVAVSMAVVSAHVTDLYREGAPSAAGYRRTVIVGAIAFLACFALAGLVTMVGPGVGLLVAGLFVVLSPQVLQTRITLTRQLTTQRLARRQIMLPPEVSKVCGESAGCAQRVTARSLSDVELRLAWCLSSTSLELYSPNAGQRYDMVVARQGYLDELERRDPEGFHRWLSAGAGPSSDPGEYFGAEAERPTSDGNPPPV